MAPRQLAVVLDGPPTPAWQARALAALSDSPSLDVVEVRLAGAVRRGAVARLHDAAERRLFGIDRDALAPATVEPYAGDAAGAATLVVWLAEQPPPADEPRELLHVRHGGRDEPPEPAFRRAVLTGAATVATEVVLRGDGGSLVVERSVSGVRPFSDTLSRTLMLWKLVEVVLRAAERAPGLAQPAPADAPPGDAPSTAALLRHCVPAWARVLVTRLLFQRPWSIRVRRRRPDPTRGWTDADEQLVRWGASPVYADPFLFEHEGRHHLFCEEVPTGTTRGVISHTELPLDGSTAPPPTTVLEAPHHLSYPFVFEHRGELLMVPETSAARRVELHRAVEFPRRWTHEADLLTDVVASDATILEHDGRLWLFAAIAAEGASSLDELHVFWADELRGPWHPHPLNPVVSDVRGARPAGAVRRAGGRIVRPAQDGSRRYGWAISFREIDLLTTTEYREHEIARLEPGGVAGARATHHHTTDGRFEAIDLRRRRRRSLSRAR